MPTYSYICDACGHRFEQFQAITAEPVKRCPKCSRERVRRRIGTGAGLIFKGSGFYITDYARPAKSQSSKSAGGANGQDESKKSGDRTASPSASTKNEA